MKVELKELFSVKTTSKTPWLTTVVKFIVRVDRQTASSYSKVLQVAFDESLADTELAAYIERRGGVAQIRSTEADAQALITGKEVSKERIELLRELLLANEYKSKYTIDYDDVVYKFPTKVGGDANAEQVESQSTFVHLLAVEGKPGEFHIVTANDFGRSFEDVILGHMDKRFNHPIEKLREGVKAQKAKHKEWYKMQQLKREEKKNLQNIEVVPA